MLVDLDPKSLGRFGAVRGGARGIYIYIYCIYIIYYMYIYIIPQYFLLNDLNGALRSY